ncbi:MAG: hypothetical protein ACP5OA_07385 [Candidatus Woesearchaeota archaeon]
MFSSTLYLILPLFIGFVVTFFVEVGIIFLFFRKIIPSKKVWLIVLLVNLFTWPLINAFSSRYSFVVLLLLESIVCIVEAGIYAAFFDKRFVRSILASIVANVLSATFGSVAVTSVLTYLLVGILS